MIKDNKNMEKKFDVFISHSSKDGLAASAIKQHLQSCGIRCWKAPDDIMPGESWPQAILRAIGNSRAMVLVWSTNSTTSGEVSKELTLAMRNNLTVVPFRIENVSASGEWEYHLANTHWMDAFSGKIEQHLDGLRDYLQKILPPTNENFNSLHNKQSNTPKKKRKIIIFSVIIFALLLLISGVYLNSKIGEKIISPVENKKPPVDISHLNNPSGDSQLPPPQITAATPAAPQSIATTNSSDYSKINHADDPEIANPHLVDLPRNIESGELEFRELSSVKSYWNHNGSVVGLIPEGRTRTFIYVKPRSGLQGLVEPGMVLFSGISDNSSYNGIARRFRKGLPPIKYNVSGPINKDGSQVVLTGEVTTRDADGSPKETILDKLVFDLK